MNKRIKKQWLAELRSGEWDQGQETLMNDNDEACCLGVLCDMAIREGVIEPWKHNIYEWTVDGNSITLPATVMEWAGLHSDNPTVLFNDEPIEISVLNDGGRQPYTSRFSQQSFAQIADIIEAQL